MVLLALGNFATMLGVEPTSPLRWAIPVAYLVIAILGVLSAVNLKVRRPHPTIGHAAGTSPSNPAAGSGAFSNKTAHLMRFRTSPFDLSQELLSVTFEEFVTTRLGALVRYATVVTWDPHLAEDITQDVLVRAQARWGRIGRLEAPEQYVKRMVLNEFLSWRRRRAARLVLLPTESLQELTAHVPDRTDAIGDQDLARRLIAALPPKQRAAIALRYYEDLTDEQIGSLLGCRTGTVRSYLSRGLATIRAALPSERASI